MNTTPNIILPHILSILLVFLISRTHGFLSAPRRRHTHSLTPQVPKHLQLPSHYSSPCDDNRPARDDTDAGPLFPERLNVIYDSKCSVCQFEVDYLQSRIDDLFGDGEPVIRFTDLEGEEGYDESDPANGGVTYEIGMKSFHAVKPNGELLHGVPVFREAYEIVDQAWIFEATKWPIVGKLASMGYDLFARIRAPLTRGSSVEDLIEKHYKQKFVQDESTCVPCQMKVGDN